MSVSAWLAACCQESGNRTVQLYEVLFSMLSMSQVFGWIFLSAATAILSSEVYTALHAIAFAVSQSEVSLLRRFSIGTARYEWSSILFHESAARTAGVKPAYRASVAVGAWMAAIAAFAGLHFTGVMSIEAGYMLGISTLVSCALFAGLYGSAFVKQRAAVAEELQGKMA